MLSFRSATLLLMHAGLSFVLFGGTMALAQSVGTSQHYLQGGTTVPVGQLEAIGAFSSAIGGCTATLISDDVVLTAAHCVCSGQTQPTGCETRATFSFVAVRPLDNPASTIDESATRRNVSVGGSVTVHPRYTVGGWLFNDFAMLRLDHPASELVSNVKPIPVERPNKKPKVGDAITLVGFGGTGRDCKAPAAGKMKVTVRVTEISDVTIVFDNKDRHVCPGDSGGPALNRAGNLVGVASTGDLSTNSNYDPTYVAYGWLFGTGRILQTVGHISLLRVHDLGTGYGPPTDPIDGEVVVKLDSDANSAFGFKLRVDSSENAGRGMLKLLRDAFNRNTPIKLEYEVTGPKNGRILRVIEAFEH